MNRRPSLVTIRRRSKSVRQLVTFWRETPIELAKSSWVMPMLRIVPRGSFSPKDSDSSKSVKAKRVRKFRPTPRVQRKNMLHALLIVSLLNRRSFSLGTPSKISISVSGLIIPTRQSLNASARNCCCVVGKKEATPKISPGGSRVRRTSRPP